MADTNLPVTPGSGTNVNGFTTPDGDFNQSVVVIDPTTGKTTSVLDVGAGKETLNVGGSFKELSGLTAGALNADLVPATDVGMYSAFALHITGTWVGTISFQGSNDNTNWYAFAATPIATGNGPTNATSSSNIIFEFQRKFRYLRVRMTAYTSGTANGTLEMFTVPFTQDNIIVNGNGTFVMSSSGATQQGVPSGAYYGGAVSRTSLPSATSAGQLVGVMSDKYGRQVVIPGTSRELVGTQSTTITASTTETTIVTAAASTFNDLTALIVSNTSAASVRVDFRDTTGGTVLFSLYVPGNDVRGITFNRPVPQTTVNTNWTAQSSASVTDLRIYAVFDKNA